MNYLSNQRTITLFHTYSTNRLAITVLHTYSTNERAITVFCIVLIYGHK